MLHRILAGRRCATRRFTMSRRVSLIGLVALLGLVGTAPSVAAAEAGPDAPMAERARACTGCHGAQGRATADGYFPRIAGKPAEYLYRQLRAFRDGDRRYAPMALLLAGLPDAYLRAFADHFAGLDLPYPPPQASPADAARRALGEALVVRGDPARGLPACAGCHGRDLAGDGAGIPGLLGLPRDYLNGQLGAWKNGQRRAAAPDCMAEIVAKLTPEDIAAATAWLSSRPADAAAPAAAGATHDPQAIARCGGATAPVVAEAAPAPDASRGEYLARIAHCAGCHSRPGEPAYSGGGPIETPYGVFFGSNLTPDPATGIGRWNREDFWNALHEGRSRDGRLLYPAFPYTEFTRLARADSDAIFDWLMTRPAVARPNTPHRLRFPVDRPLALRLWRWLYFEPGEHRSDPARSAAWNRGAYLVEAAGHCGACHSPRNRLGATIPERALDGAPMPVVQGRTRWRAPSLRDPADGATRAWSIDETVRWLREGANRHAIASGPMAEVVAGSTQYLRDADARAIAEYLQALPAPAATRPTDTTGPRPPEPVLAAGARLYEDHCSDCHGTGGGGSPALGYPALAGNRQVLAVDPDNLIATLRHGGFGPATAARPRPAGMPPFAAELDASQAAAVLSYIRNAWGNRAPAVHGHQIETR